MCDIAEDPSVDKDLIISKFNECGYKVNSSVVVQKEKEQQFTNFVSKSYYGILFSL